jgi:type 1 fimbriae regulatory protein FimB/type 1 fimbriae regulatory protein FimE
MPATVLRTVWRLASRDGQLAPPGRRSNAESGREREYLTPAEIERLVKTARKRGRHGSRDALAILMGYRHGLRVSELVGLRWSQVDFTTARLTVHRAKGSAGSTHPILGDELRELRKLQREQPAGSQFIFNNELGAPMSVAGFQRMLKRVGVECGLPLVHPHMLRHSTGFALADKGRDLREIQDFLGHRSINNTVIYTKLRPGRFDRIWD